MSQTTAAKILKILGSVLVLVWVINLSSRTHQGLFALLIYIGIIVAGVFIGRQGTTAAKPSKAKPNLPQDFVVAYEHDNIALDTATGRIWLRDGQRERVFSKREILGWQMQTNEMQTPDTYGNGIINRGTRIKHNARIAIQTSDMDYPLYTIRFRAHSELFSTDRNIQDATAWTNRLTAFMNSR